MEPMAPFNGTSDEMKAVGKALDERGLFTMVRWNGIMTNPPLCITEEQLGEGFAIIDEALDVADDAVTYGTHASRARRRVSRSTTTSRGWTSMPSGHSFDRGVLGPRPLRATRWNARSSDPRAWSGCTTATGRWGSPRRSPTAGSACLADVYVLEDHRGRGLGVELVRAAVDESPFSHARWMLHTQDAHGLYERFGFGPAEERYLERPPAAERREAGEAGDGLSPAFGPFAERIHDVGERGSRLGQGVLDLARGLRRRRCGSRARPPRAPSDVRRAGCPRSRGSPRGDPGTGPGPRGARGSICGVQRRATISAARWKCSQTGPSPSAHGPDATPPRASISPSSLIPVRPSGIDNTPESVRYSRKGS